MIYGYARVSTASQGKLGNSLEAQEQILKQNNCDVIVKEIYTGTKTDRPKFNKLLSQLKCGDILIVCKLDRFARTAVEGVQTINHLLQMGVKVHILNMGLLEDTPMGRLILTTMLAFAEFERDMIVERTQCGKEIAKQNNPYFKEGRPNTPIKQIAHALELLNTKTYTEVVALTGISKSTLIRAKRKTASLLV